VEGDVAVAVPGGAGGEVDQVAAVGGAAGLAMGPAGQGRGGAQQVVGDGGAGEPGGVGGELARGQVCQGAVVAVGEDLLDDGVVAVLVLGPGSSHTGVGEDRVVPPGGEQLVLPGSRGVLVPTGRRPGGWRAAPIAGRAADVRAICAALGISRDAGPR
jgi:hypothetical protein